jgi:ABC-2 type transport system ATP-binding protein
MTLLATPPSFAASPTPARPAPIVSITGVSHRYGERLALNNLSLTIPRGTFFGLLGPNGSGKSTLFRLLATLVPPQSGQITIDGCSLPSQAQALRQKLGVIFQSPALDKQLTVLENLTTHAALYSIPAKEALARATDILARLSLTDRKDDRVNDLSGGLRRRVEIAKCLLTRPSILILDEPSTGLDPTARMELYNALRQAMATNDVTVLLTTHLMDEADRCDSLAILSTGQLVAQGTPDELKSALGGDVLTLHSHDRSRLHAALTADGVHHIKAATDHLRIESPTALALLTSALTRHAPLISAASVSRPTLEDVYFHHTGKVFGIE